MNISIKDSINNLYDVFQKYPLTTVEGCPCCVSQEDQQRVTSKPLRALTTDDLDRYTQKAMSTWGTVEDFRHFLPRILQLLAQFDYSFDEWGIFHKLTYGHWRDWPLDEQQAINRYTEALWRSMLEQYSSNMAGLFTNYFSMLVLFTGEITPFLQVWESTGTESAVRHLANFVYEENHTIFYDGCFGHLNRRDEKVEALAEWLLSTPVLDALARSYYQYADTDFANTLALAYDILVIQRKAKAAHDAKHR